MNDIDIYNPPNSEVSDSTRILNKKPSWLTRFLLTFAFTFLFYTCIYILMAVITSKIDSFSFQILFRFIKVSALAGGVAVCVPVKSKFVFIFAGFISSMAIALEI